MNFSKNIAYLFKYMLLLPVVISGAVLLSGIAGSSSNVSEAELQNVLLSASCPESPLAPVSAPDQNQYPGALYNSSSRSAIPLLVSRRNPEQLSCRPCRFTGTAPEVPELLLLSVTYTQIDTTAHLIQYHTIMARTIPVRAGPQTV